MNTLEGNEFAGSRRESGINLGDVEIPSDIMEDEEQGDINNDLLDDPQYVDPEKAAVQTKLLQEEQSASDVSRTVPVVVKVIPETNPDNKIGWKNKRYSGLLLTFCSGFLFASVGLIVKYLKGYHVLNLGFFRFMGMFFPAIPLVAYSQHGRKKRQRKQKEMYRNNNDNDTGDNSGIVEELGRSRNQSVLEPIWPLTDPKKLRTMLVLFGRALVGFAAVTSHFLSIQYMPVADAMVIGSCSSVFVTFAAHIFLGEKCGVFPLLSALLTILGVGIIARPPILTGEEEYNLDTLIGTCFALGRMTFTSVAIVFVRYLRGVNAGLIILSIGFLQLLQSISAALILGVFSLPTDPMSLFLCCTLGILSFASQISLTLALKCEQAGPFAIVRTSSDTVFAFLLQFLVLGVVPDMFSLMGAFVVISAVFLTVLRKWISSLPKDDPRRIKYWFVLK